MQYAKPRSRKVASATVNGDRITQEEWERRAHEERCAGCQGPSSHCRCAFDNEDTPWWSVCRQGTVSFYHYRRVLEMNIDPEIGRMVAVKAAIRWIKDEKVLEILKSASSREEKSRIIREDQLKRQKGWFNAAPTDFELALYALDEDPIGWIIERAFFDKNDIVGIARDLAEFGVFC